LRSVLADRLKADPFDFLVTISWVGVSSALSDAASPLRILRKGDESGGFGDTCLLFELDRFLSLEPLRLRLGIF